MARFYEESLSIVDLLAKSGIPSGAQHLVEMLQAYISHDPRGVFLRIRQIVEAAAPNGYQFDSLAVDLIVRIVERYLAEFRQVLQQDQQCLDALIYLLNTFVRAGWPEARRLTYRLEDIYR